MNCLSQLTVHLKRERLDFGVLCGLPSTLLIQPVKHKMAMFATNSSYQSDFAYPF